MVAVPIPWVKLWRYKLLIPLVLAMAFLIWGAGATAGAEVAVTGNETAAELWTGDSVQAAMNQAITEVEQDTVLTRTGAELLIRPVMGPMMNVLQDGFWFGYENPDLGEHAGGVALVAAYGTMAVYVYVIYRMVRGLVRW